MELYFSDHFKVSEDSLAEYGAFNISLITDLPLFIDPFLLFNSDKAEYQNLHQSIINYLLFLKTKAAAGNFSEGTLRSWYAFKEIEQNWLGFSVTGNKGRGLGLDFAKSLSENLNKIFQDFGNENITRGAHLEKLCLVKEGVGKDTISDFATNLIKEFLLAYTEEFAKACIEPGLCKKFRIRRTRFDYGTETWVDREYMLPNFGNDFVILTPKDLLTKDDTWINRRGLLHDFEQIPNSISNTELRFQINNYFESLLKNISKKAEREPTKKEKNQAIIETIYKFPTLIDYYIKFKEDNGEAAESISSQKVALSEAIFVTNVQEFVSKLGNTKFYAPSVLSYEEAKNRLNILKEFIENNDGYRLFYDGNLKDRVRDEKDLQLLFHLICYQSIFDVNREPNNGRGPVDFAISMGSKDKSLVEFKLAGNKSLKRNLQRQVEIYKKANRTALAFKVIIYFTKEEYDRVVKILEALGLFGNENIVLINARKDDKPSASKA